MPQQTIINYQLFLRQETNWEEELIPFNNHSTQKHPDRFDTIIQV